MGVFTQLGDEPLTHTRSFLSGGPLRLLFSSFSFLILVTSLLAFLCSCFVSVFYGPSLPVGNISSGTENLTEVTETMLTPTPTLTQQQEVYVFHLYTPLSHTFYNIYSTYTELPHFLSAFVTP